MPHAADHNEERKESRLHLNFFFGPPLTERLSSVEGGMLCRCGLKVLEYI